MCRMSPLCNHKITQLLNKCVILWVKSLGQIWGDVDDVVPAFIHRLVRIPRQSAFYYRSNASEDAEDH